MLRAAQENLGPNTMRGRQGKTIEQVYQKKTQLEHILLRPDTYVGSTEHQFQDMWIFDERLGEIVQRKIDFVPALYKIFDEILVNAADNLMRDPKMDLIDVIVDRHRGSISVMNNGKGIPVQIHREHKCYVPELIFGHLLTGDNYNDDEKKVTGGRNGYGAKLANVFSTKFIIETSDKTQKKRYTQTFTKNMSQKGEPIIEESSGQDFTRVTFFPDFSRFGMTNLDDDHAGLMMKRVYDVAGSTRKSCRVVLNGKPLNVTCFKDYVDLYMGKGRETIPDCIHEKVNDRWEVAVSFTDGSFQQVSFVNSINTIKGGTHVTHVTEQLVEAILKVVKGKNRGGMDIKPNHVKNHLSVFVNCLIENPAFDSQTKETLTTKQTKFGSTCDLPDKMIKQVMKSGIVDLILDWVKAKQKVDIGRALKGGSKNMTRVLGIPKLEDANDAGGKNSQDCTLILTEGDSAKALAVSGLSIVGRDKFGVYPLRGKVLNVRDANYKQVTGNKEISELLKILGLDTKREYESNKQLRYGSVMVMTDQDHDGSHIKGLLINLFHHWWPSLLRMDGFLKEFVTPIVKVWKAGKADTERREETSFFTLMEYQKWKERTNDGKGWKTKYYKGLGTSTAKEAKEYFRDIEKHELGFRWSGKQDDENIDLAFNKKRADHRKDWINNARDEDHIDHTKRSIGYTEFVNKELVHFAKYDVMRSIPSMVDGLKPSQRKVLYCAIKKKLKSDLKVAQFVGYISEQAAYHHGEASLENTIINLAQNFVGSNNCNLLFPSGQFGTRIVGGKDHAAARYIFTHMAGTARRAFHPDDDPILEYLNEEGLSIEPRWYCPILPMVLVNGAEGIGVGWSSSVPNYNPRDIICNIRRWLRGGEFDDMIPWYKGFKGSIVRSEAETGKFDVLGVLEKKNETTLEITEVPIRVWTQSYKEFLETLMPSDGKSEERSAPHVIEDFREFHSENSVHFVLTLTPDKMRAAEKTGLEKQFKLKASLCTTNMTLFDADGKIQRYNSVLEILNDFVFLRRKVYDRRKKYQMAKLDREREILSQKARFILMVVNGELELRKRKKVDLLKELQKKGFKPMSEIDAMLDGLGKSGDGQESTDANGGEALQNESAEAEKSDYDYLLGMSLWSLTYEKVEEIKKQLETKKQQLEELRRTMVEEMWDRDLLALSQALDEADAKEAEEAAACAVAAETRRRRLGARGRPVAPAPMPRASSRPASGPCADVRGPVVDRSGWEAPPRAATAGPRQARTDSFADGGAPGPAPPEPLQRRPSQRQTARRERSAEPVRQQLSGGVLSGSTEETARHAGRLRRDASQPAPDGARSGSDLLSRLLARPPAEPEAHTSRHSELGGDGELFSMPQRIRGGSGPRVLGDLPGPGAPARAANAAAVNDVIDLEAGRRDRGRRGRSEERLQGANPMSSNVGQLLRGGGAPSRDGAAPRTEPPTTFSSGALPGRAPPQAEELLQRARLPDAPSVPPDGPWPGGRGGGRRRQRVVADDDEDDEPLEAMRKRQRAATYTID